MRELRQSTGVKTYIYIYIYHANARENVKGSGCLNCLSGSLNNYFKDEKERKKKRVKIVAWIECICTCQD